MTHEERLNEMGRCPYCTDGYAAEGLPCVICEQRLSQAERAACLAGAEALRQNEIMRRALEQFADNGLSADNCASVEVAAGRVRAIARAALLAFR